MHGGDKIALKAALATAYNNPEEIILILRIVGIPPQDVQFTGSTTQIWSSVIEEADTVDFTSQLIVYELKRHPHNETIQTLANKYPIFNSSS